MVKIKILEQTRANTKLNFTPNQEDRLIEFVKKHPVLYDTKNSLLRKTGQKKKLWDEIGYLICKNGHQCARKWKNIRDYYIKLQQKPIASSIINESTRKRNEQLKFLNNFITNKKNMYEPNLVIPAKIELINDKQEHKLANRIATSIGSSDDRRSSTCTLNESFSRSTPKNTFTILKPRSTTRSSNTKPSIYQKNPNHLPQHNNVLDQFFASMCSTVKTFSAVMQAHAKLKIAQIIGEMELDAIETYNNKYNSMGFVTSSSD